MPRPRSPGRPWGVGAARGELLGRPLSGAEVSGSGKGARQAGGGAVEGQDAGGATRSMHPPGIPRPLRASDLSWRGS